MEAVEAPQYLNNTALEFLIRREFTMKETCEADLIKGRDACAGKRTELKPRNCVVGGRKGW